MQPLPYANHQSQYNMTTPSSMAWRPQFGRHQLPSSTNTIKCPNPHAACCQGSKWHYSQYKLALLPPSTTHCTPVATPPLTPARSHPAPNRRSGCEQRSPALNGRQQPLSQLHVVAAAGQAPALELCAELVDGKSQYLTLDGHAISSQCHLPHPGCPGELLRLWGVPAIAIGRCRLGAGSGCRCRGNLWGRRRWGARCGRHLCCLGCTVAVGAWCPRCGGWGRGVRSDLRRQHGGRHKGRDGWRRGGWRAAIAAGHGDGHRVRDTKGC
mmetsp:Transcript_10996/g.27038  ORF Transcript_10996/g.27038 Transcript_10996/m.27038 type:complete len:268 (+) Transcript_10996:133-936(+)